MNFLEVPCVACAGMMKIRLEDGPGDRSCPHCGTVHQIEDAAEEVGNEIWNPDEDRVRMGGPEEASGLLSADIPEREPEPDAIAGVAATLRKNRPRKLSVARVFAAVAVLASAAGAAWHVQNQQLRERELLGRIHVLELKQKAKDQEGGYTGEAVSILQHQFAEMDERLMRLSSVVQMQGGSTLQSEFVVQRSADLLARQTRELRKIRTKLDEVERVVADRDRRAREAFELSVRKRQEADRAAAPIRRRIATFESKRDELVRKYRTAVTPRRPQGVVSSKRAAELMKSQEARNASLLAHLRSEIALIEKRIREEERNVDALYDFSPEP